MKILVLGASGMLGSAIIHIFNERSEWCIYGTIRSKKIKRYFSDHVATNLIYINDVLDHNSLSKIIRDLAPDIVINCISLSKDLLKISDPMLMIPIYALLPHQLAQLCEVIGARLIHISSDGVFSGKQGNYSENDLADANDMYGRVKYLGEVDSSNAITIRTSIIGHEIATRNGLIEWFLGLKDECICFANAIFTGLPTVVLAEILRDVIIPKKNLSGIYHIAAEPITKCDLLNLIAKEYSKSIKLKPVNDPVIDRSLNAEKFITETGYKVPEWPVLIKTMHSYQQLH